MGKKEQIYVIDADTIAIGEDRIRLKGIDAPEISQTCLCQGQEIPCGKQATTALKAFMKDKPLACEKEKRDIYGRFLGDCFIEQNDKQQSLSQWLLEEGYAMTYHQTSEVFLEIQSQAISKKKGFWACEDFQDPALFRKAQKKTTKKTEHSY